MLLRPAEAEKTFHLLLEATHDLCRANGAEFALVYFPFRGQVAEDAIVYRQALQELHHTRGCPTLNLTESLRQLDTEKPAYFEHDVHFNAYGHQLDVGMLYDFLAQNTPLKRSVATTAEKRGEGPVKRPKGMRELHFSKWTEVLAATQAPSGGDPLAYAVHGEDGGRVKSYFPDPELLAEPGRISKPSEMSKAESLDGGNG